MKNILPIVIFWAVTAFLPAAELYKCPSAPLIDGQEDAVWQGAATWQLRGWRGKPDPVMGTQVKIMYDDANLYFFAYCREVNLTEALSQEKFNRHDAPVWNICCVEFFIDTKNDGRSYHQFVVDIHNMTADLWFFDPEAPRVPLQWDCYWNHAVGTYDDGWTVEVAIPFNSLHCQPGVIPYLGLNISRPRTIAPFERGVLTTGSKHLNSTPHFLAFKDVQRLKPELSAEIMPAQVYIGSNALTLELSNLQDDTLAGELELCGSDNSNGRELFRKSLPFQLAPREKRELSIPYQVQIPGNIQMAVYFSCEGKKKFLQARNFYFRQTLEIGNPRPICYQGRQQPLYLRTFTAAASRKLRMEIFSPEGQRLAVSELQSLPVEGFILLPSEALPAGEYAVKIIFMHDDSQSEASLPLRVIPRL